MAEFTGFAGPVVGGGAGFHDDTGRRMIGQKSIELGPRQTLPDHNSTSLVGDGYLKNRLCEILPQWSNTASYGLLHAVN